MDLNLGGRSVLVTGASKGIGRGCAGLFAAEGANLHLASRNADRLDVASRETRSGDQADARFHPLVLSTSGAAEELAEPRGDWH